MEVDGRGHRSKKIKAADQRKDAYLKANGWTVLRFWNWDVLRDLETATQTIVAAASSSTSKPEQGTTSPTPSVVHNCHAAKNMGGGNDDKASQRAQAVLELQEHLPQARVI